MRERPFHWAGLAILLLAASARGEGLFPDDPAPAQPEPAKPAPPAAEPTKSEPAPAKPEASPQETLAVPAGARTSKPSSSGEVRTVAGVRIVGAMEGASAREAWFEVERWISREKGWMKSPFNVKKGEVIGKPDRKAGKMVDFSTPWTLLEIKKEARSTPGQPVSRIKTDDKGNPVLDADGRPVRVVEPGPPETRNIFAALLQHARATTKDGSLLTAKVDLVKGARVDLPEVSEDEAPAPPGNP